MDDVNKTTSYNKKIKKCTVPQNVKGAFTKRQCFSQEKSHFEQNNNSAKTYNEKTSVQPTVDVNGSQMSLETRTQSDSHSPNMSHRLPPFS